MMRKFATRSFVPPMIFLMLGSVSGCALGNAGLDLKFDPMTVKSADGFDDWQEVGESGHGKEQGNRPVIAAKDDDDEDRPVRKMDDDDGWEDEEKPREKASEAAFGVEALNSIFRGRDENARLSVTPSGKKLRIGKDFLALSVTGDRDGYVYVLLADEESPEVTLLFPNRVDAKNQIKAGQTITLPPPDSQLQIGADGPPGENSVLVIVSSKKIDVDLKRSGDVSPFLDLVAERSRVNRQGKPAERRLVLKTAGGKNFGGPTVSECKSDGTVQRRLALKNRETLGTCDGYSGAILTIQEVR